MAPKARKAFSYPVSAPKARSELHKKKRKKQHQGRTNQIKIMSFWNQTRG